jgi:alcohol dehydrogenase
MRAAVLVEFGRVEVRDLPEPEAGPGEVVVQVEACGVCRSDWHLWRGDPSLVMYMEWSGGKLPIVMGHEVVGRVAQAGDGVTAVKEGDRVVIPASSTGDGRRCGACMDGRSNVCEHLWIPGFGTDGGYAEYVRVPAGSVPDLTLVPEALAGRAPWLAICGCGMGTAFNAVVDKARVQPGERVVVTGTGGVGLSVVAIAAKAGAQVVGVDVNPAALERAAKLGATATVLVEREDSELTKKITEAVGGPADVAIDTTGNPQVGVGALLALRPGGRLVLSGLMVRGAETMALPADAVVAREVHVAGALMLAAQRYPTLFGLLARGDIDLDPVIYREIGVDDVQEAFEEMSEFGNAGRFVVTDFS